jgi:enoyl-CoA hydratase/carnithine racemase
VARLIGESRALELIATGDWRDADTALGWGLVNRVVSVGAAFDTALAFAESIAAHSAPAIAAAIGLVRRTAGERDADARERRAVVAALFAPDGREGVAAFVARRSAEFRAPPPSDG